MASAKDLKKKIQSIANTSKITRTMEMVSAAKAKQTQTRVEANTPYSKQLVEILHELTEGGGASLDHPLARKPADAAPRNALLVVSANRGLCGGYNTNILVRAEKWIAEQRLQGRETDVSMIGKKGIARAKYRKMPLVARYTHIEDRPSFAEAEVFARGFMERFLRGEVDEVWVLSTRYLSAATQRPEFTRVLPIETGVSGEDADKKGGSVGSEFIFEPDAATILDRLLPFSVSQLVYRLLIEAACSEQLARRMAMKLATDNAADLQRSYTREYNRQRQAGITQQIMEIVGGAEALS